MSSSPLTTVYAEFLPNNGLKASQNLHFPGNRQNIDACLYLCVPALYALGEGSLIPFPSELFNMQLECLKCSVAHFCHPNPGLVVCKEAL